MNKTDTIEQKPIFFYWDKLYTAYFTMRTVYVLEQKYGTIRAAIKALLSDNTEMAVVAGVDFLYALLGIERKQIDELLNINRFMDALLKIRDALVRHFPDITNEEPQNLSDDDESYDWDNLYYIGRYRLQMSDDEFWKCTPRRFFKLHYLWKVEHGLEKGAPRKLCIDDDFVF